MSIQATCDSCGKTYSLNEKHIGKRLPCKECGEDFEVHDADDFDAAPSRPRRDSGQRGPARSSKKPGKKRRKSGPNWLLIGLGGAGGLLVLGGLIWAVLMNVGNTHDKVLKNAIAALEDVPDILADVKDVPSAQAADVKLDAISKRMAELEEQYKELDATAPITDKEEMEVREKYFEQYKAIRRRIDDEMNRLKSNEEAHQIIRFAMIDVNGKTHAVINARSVKQVAEFTERVEERQAKARERTGQGPVPAHLQPPADEMQGPKVDPHTHQAEIPKGMLGVTLKMDYVLNFKEIFKRLREMSGKTQVLHAHSNSQGTTVTIAPMTDLDRFANAVDFGKVTEMNRDSRIITIEPDEAYTFKPGGTVAVDIPQTGN